MLPPWTDLSLRILLLFCLIEGSFIIWWSCDRVHR
ncbi:hypothetical protein KY289_001002 [Solanum tuberosum]|nr:hypothetical protein KY289_001002 [Solanum tuberosum]